MKPDSTFIRYMRSKDFWPCKACSTKKHIEWHKGEVCPNTKKPRIECEDQSKELRGEK